MPALARLTPSDSPALAAFLGRYAGLKARLPGADLPWLAARREAAAAALEANGLPGPRAEAWRFTNLRNVAEAAFAEPLAVVGSGDEAAALAAAPELGRFRAVLVDGRFRADLSALDGLPDGIAVGSLADALAADGGGLEPVLGALARPEAEPFAALNTALAEDGIVIRVAPGCRVAERVQIVSIATAPGERPVAFHPRLLVTLGAGASLTLVETAIGTGSGRYLANPLAEIDLAAGAEMTHLRIQDEGREGIQLATVYARVAAGAHYDSFALALGGRLARNEVHVLLAGEGAACGVNGAYLGYASRHLDNSSVIRHAAPACRSRQTYKGVLGGAARGVFQGKIEVDRIAQKTDGYQMNQALLLSPEAEVDSKPQLEIYADDVKCSHGATVGELDPAQLFYLRSRGIPEHEARAMLVHAFLGDAIELVVDPELRAALGTLVAHWWQRREAEA